MPAPSALVATLGTSPAVITWTLDHLLFGPSPEEVRKLVVVHAGNPSVMETVDKLLEAFPGAKWTDRDGGRVGEGATYQSDGRATSLEVRCVAVGSEELVDEASCNEYLATLCREIWRERRRCGDVIVSISGGRKHASAYAFLAAMLYGASRVLHVLTKPEWIEEQKDKTRLHVDPAHYDVLTIPFPPLYPGHDEALLGEPKITNEQLIAQINSFCKTLPEFVRRGRTVTKGDLGTPETKPLWATSPAMARTWDTAMAHAKHRAPLYVWGRPGSGRSELAEAIDRAGHWAGAFKEVPAHSLSVDALNGVDPDGRAETPRPGFLEECDAGTLFIDQIEEMPLATQRAVVPFLADLPDTKIAGKPDREARVRLICSGTRPLGELKADGLLVPEWSRVRFAQEIAVPPLSERVADIGALTEKLVEENGRRFGTPGAQVTDELLSSLERFTWRGLQIADLAQALLEWASTGGSWANVLDILEAHRPSPVWENQESRERKLLEAWHRIRRRPEEFEAVRQNDPDLVPDLVNYACLCWMAKPQIYPVKNRDEFCERYFGATYGRLMRRRK